MKLNNFWKLVIGIATAFIAVLPVLFFIGWMSFMIVAIGSSDTVNGKTPDAFVYLFILLISVQIFWSFLRLAMLAFYQAHAIVNEEGSKFYRILLSIGNFFLPYISMPIYYFIFVYPEKIPNWALENPLPKIEEIDEENPKEKNQELRKKSQRKMRIS